MMAFLLFLPLLSDLPLLAATVHFLEGSRSIGVLTVFVVTLTSLRVVYPVDYNYTGVAKSFVLVMYMVEVPHFSKFHRKEMKLYRL